MAKKAPLPARDMYALAIDAAAQALVPSEVKSFEDLAQRLGVAPSELYQWRSGRRPLPWKRARSVALVLRRRPEEISGEYAEILADIPAFKVSGDSKAKLVAAPLSAPSQPARPDKEILFEAVQIALTEAASSRTKITAAKLADAYELALSRKRDGV